MQEKIILLKKIIVIFVIISLVIIVIFLKNKNEEYLIYDENILEEDFLQNEIIYENEITENNKILEEKIKIYITGEVNSPGVKEIKYGSRIEDVINAAGGVTLNANLKEVNLAYQVEDGQKIYIPNINEKIEEIISEENGEGVIEEKTNNSKNRININNANLEELCKIPGVGEALATRIINYREENGKFNNIDALKNVSGIGEKKFESLKEYIVVK